MARLVQTHEGINIRDYDLERDVTHLGRTMENDVVVDDAAVSSKHAKIVRGKSAYLDDHYDYSLEDLNSTNGTKVNGERVTQHLLKQGDVLKLGKHEFLFDTQMGAGLEETAIYIPDN